MNRRLAPMVCSLAFAVVVAAVAASAVAQQPPPVQADQTKQPVPAFRSRITLVPLDVRVLDRDGKPVTDLTQDDFTILEKGEKQTVSHFSTSSLTAEAPSPKARPMLKSAPAGEMASPRGRTFLLVVGRGRIQEPFDGVGAMITFVRDLLLPQDFVAVSAYNRMTDFTTDHGKIVEILKKIADRHERIEALLQQHESGMSPIYSKCPPCLPAQMMGRINEIFLWPGAIVSREMPQAMGYEEDLYNGSARRYYDALLDTELAAGREFRMIGDAAAERRAELSGSSSSSRRVQARIKVYQDRDKLLNGISEMRYFDGEKHIVFLSDTGLSTDSVDEDEVIGRAAADARIALHTIITGGLGGGSVVGNLSSGWFSPVGSTSTVDVHAGVNLDPSLVMKHLAADSGGTASITKYPIEALTGINEVTRFVYLLGFYPTTTARDGKFRDVQVKVSRPGVSVLVRAGYYDEDAIVPKDRAAFVAYQRIGAVGNTRDVVTDLAVSVKATQPKAQKNAPPNDVQVEMKIDLARVAFDLVDGRHAAALEYRIYCGDSKEHIVGQQQGTMRLNLSDATFQRFSKDGVPYSVKVPVKGQTKTVKIIVYDPGSDLAGSAVARVK